MSKFDAFAGLVKFMKNELDIIIFFLYPRKFKLQVLVCGDIRGNLVLFPLLKSVLLGTLVSSDVKISPSSCFKGAHGISSISSVAVARLSSNQIEIRSVRQNSLFDRRLAF